MKRQYRSHPQVKYYEDTVALAIETRTERTVQSISWVQYTFEITLDSAPDSDTLDEIDDIMAVTERSRTDVSDAVVTYEGQPVDPADPTLPDDTLSLGERICQTAGDSGSQGRSTGGVPPEAVNPQTPARGATLTVELPDGASDDAIRRLDSVMLALGKIPV